jgi:hypothetical protein
MPVRSTARTKKKAANLARPGRASRPASRDDRAVVAALKSVFAPLRSRLVVVKDGPDGCYLDTRHQAPNGKPLFFGAVRAGKSYVSFHLMPVYACPDLAKGLSPRLRARMQGKACFNFKTVEPDLIAELATLTKRGFERFEKGDYVGGAKSG